MKQIALVFIIALALNLLWEHLHYPLYDCSSICAVRTLNQFSFIPLLIRASFFDACFITALYLCISFLHRSLSWTHTWRGADTLIILAIGITAASLIERSALSAHKWAYSAAMPLVPFLAVGLSPFVQLALLSLATYAIVAKLT